MASVKTFSVCNFLTFNTKTEKAAGAKGDCAKLLRAYYGFIRVLNHGINRLPFLLVSANKVFIHCFKF